MKFFEKYVSNTVAGSGNQTFFVSDEPNEIRKGRVYYKIFAGGEFEYSMLFSNIIDSTFADGSHSHCNLVLDTWNITELKVGITSSCTEDEAAEPDTMHCLTFSGKKEKEVAPGEFFATDPIKLSPKSGEYICLEISFFGKQIPYHEESIIPSFVCENGGWVKSKLHPFPGMIGCDRRVKCRIGFLGDSITQGIGVAVNSYDHWSSVVANGLGADNAYWNLGIGYGRAADGATDGAWLFKAKQNDTVVLCFGVNDILRGYSADQIKANLEKIIDILHSNGIKVFLQSVPPFDYSGENIEKWNTVNSYIRTVLSKKAEFFFDCAEYLKKSDGEPYIAPYGGHPNSTGCKIWGENFCRELLQNDK